MQVLRRFPTAQVGLFALGAFVHTFVNSHRHARAATAESVIGAVLLAGLLATFAAPARTRTIALGVQAFALLGTLVGLFTIIIGVGPRSGFDFALHGTMIAVLIAGLVNARRYAMA